MLVITLTETIEAVAFLFLIVFAVSISASEWRRQKNCKHDGGVNETSSCQAICKLCGKDLGFIGNWRHK
jgi:hypothetical protein